MVILRLFGRLDVRILDMILTPASHEDCNRIWCSVDRGDICVCGVCNKHKDILLTAGYNQTKIDELNRLTNQLDTANIDQQVFIKERARLTSQRKILMNEVWAVIQHICKVGKIIYVNDYGHYQQYVMYEKKSDTEPEVQENPAPEV